MQAGVEFQYSISQVYRKPHLINIWLHTFLCKQTAAGLCTHRRHNEAHCTI